MKLTSSLGLRRIINSYFDPFSKVPSPDRWLQREKIQRFTAWQNSSYRDIYKHASIKLRYKLMAYYSMHRQDEPRLEKHYSEVRVTNALAEHDFEYKHFKNMLDKAHILIDNNTLAKLAIYEPQSFHVRSFLKNPQIFKEM
ncbi:hypothetical protein WR25_20565 isoform B [Diploscapter pachys]|uniref:Uncharacterized protein n=1 Tax=Diploscapter pachys TaxID=2018661 RepID=A0A2A2JSS3_9BILA|nr:hypothetical protein WR25_20565 isoform B [Diploscapter pachys]